MAQKDRWDALLYPGSGTLRNIQGIENESTWAQVEGNLTATRAMLLPEFGFDGSVGDQLCQTHAYLFQDCYDWAGTMRTVNMAIPVPSDPTKVNTFADYETIETRLAELDYIVEALDEASFADKLDVLAYT